MDARDPDKQDAARRAVREVRDGMVLGLGTGSTARHVVEAVGAAVRAGLRVTAVASSEQTAALARQHGVALVDLEHVERLDLVIDGADEVDGAGGMIKGRGGALLREKVLAVNAARIVIVIDPSKRVERLGTRQPLPVEVVPFARPAVARRLEAMGLRPTLRRRADGSPFATDQGNQILDCATGPIDDPQALARALDAVVGVVEHGLFLDLNPEVVVGHGSPPGRPER